MALARDYLLLIEFSFQQETERYKTCLLVLQYEIPPCLTTHGGYNVGKPIVLAKGNGADRRYLCGFRQSIRTSEHVIIHECMV